MRVIVGLGNPGTKYEKTRHNVGFMALDFLAEKLNAPNFKMNKKFNAKISETKLGREKIILAKPQTFMNDSGEAVLKILSFYKVKPEGLTVIHDDLDIDAGIKKSFDRGSAGHNGVTSIISFLKTQAFYRLRIGIGRPKNDNYVLEKFSKEEMEKMKIAFEYIWEYIKEGKI